MTSVLEECNNLQTLSLTKWFQIWKNIFLRSPQPKCEVTLDLEECKKNLVTLSSLKWLQIWKSVSVPPTEAFSHCCWSHCIVTTECGTCLTQECGFDAGKRPCFCSFSCNKRGKKNHSFSAVLSGCTACLFAEEVHLGDRLRTFEGVSRKWVVIFLSGLVFRPHELKESVTLFRYVGILVIVMADPNTALPAIRLPHHCIA